MQVSKVNTETLMDYNGDNLKALLGMPSNSLLFVNLPMHDVGFHYL